MNTEVHEPTAACGDFHCCWHNVDEATEGYRLCYECKHMYLTEAELVAAYFDRMVAVAATKRIAGDTIVFCPLCSHDF